MHTKKNQVDLCRSAVRRGIDFQTDVFDLDDFISPVTVPRRTAPHRIAPYRFAPYRIASHRTVDGRRFISCLECGQISQKSHHDDGNNMTVMAV